jgi:hypothetical protein
MRHSARPNRWWHAHSARPIADRAPIFEWEAVAGPERQLAENKTPGHGELALSSATPLHALDETLCLIKRPF